MWLTFFFRKWKTHFLDKSNILVLKVFAILSSKEELWSKLQNETPDDQRDFEKFSCEIFPFEFSKLDWILIVYLSWDLIESLKYMISTNHWFITSFYILRLNFHLFYWKKYYCKKEKIIETLLWQKSSRILNIEI